LLYLPWRDSPAYVPENQEIEGSFGLYAIKTAFLLETFGLAVLYFIAASQTSFPQETAGTAASVEIHVRVLDNGQFINTLSLGDFEILDGGRVHKPEALYLIEGQNLVRREELRPFNPQLSRNYYLLFQTTDYDPKLAEAVDYLFKSLLLPGDTMTLMTPMKPYSLTRDALLKMPKETLSKEMQQILRKDIQAGGGDYREIVKDLKRLVKSISGSRAGFDSDMETDMSIGDFGLESKLESYKTALMKLEAIRIMDEKKLLNFAQALKSRPGQKFVFFFYQREFRPEISPGVLNTMMSMYQDQQNILSTLMDLFHFYKREMTFNVARVKQAFADASISFNFIFMNKESQYIMGLFMKEHSEDLYAAFREMARASGGFADNAPNPAAAFKNAAISTDKYYLLYYTPQEVPQGREFRNLLVRVKGKDYLVFHRQGYFSE